jgi:hypothetical protein
VDATIGINQYANSGQIGARPHKPPSRRLTQGRMDFNASDTQENDDDRSEFYKNIQTKTPRD